MKISFAAVFTLILIPYQSLACEDIGRLNITNLTLQLKIETLEDRVKELLSLLNRGNEKSIFSKKTNKKPIFSFIENKKIEDIPEKISQEIYGKKFKIIALNTSHLKSIKLKDRFTIEDLYGNSYIAEVNMFTVNHKAIYGFFPDYKNHKFHISLDNQNAYGQVSFPSGFHKIRVINNLGAIYK
jgi:hypothetical protein